MPVTVRVLGCGDAFGSGGRSHTCFYLDAPGTKLLVDFGASALVSMHRFGVDPRTIDAVLLTHLHGDHFGGLPFLLLDAAYISRRTRPLLIAGPPATRERLQGACNALFPGFWDAPKKFAIEYLTLEDGRSIDVAGASVTPTRVIHDSGSTPFAVRIQHSGCVLAYSGDTAWTDRLLAVAAGADLFLCEASSYDAAIPNHMTYQTVAAHRSEFNAARIVLTHLGPDVLARKDSLDLEMAEDGQTYTLAASPVTS